MSEEIDKRHMKIAALAGAGLPLADVAREVGVTSSAVSYVIEQKIKTNKDGLGDVYDDFRRQMAPLVTQILVKVLYRLDQKVDGRKVEIRDLLGVLRELAPVAGMGGGIGDDGPTITKTARVDLKNPDTVKALREALLVERKEKEKALVADIT